MADCGNGGTESLEERIKRLREKLEAANIIRKKPAPVTPGDTVHTVPPANYGRQYRQNQRDKVNGVEYEDDGGARAKPENDGNDNFNRQRHPRDKVNGVEYEDDGGARAKPENDGNDNFNRQRHPRGRGNRGRTFAPRRHDNEHVDNAAHGQENTNRGRNQRRKEWTRGGRNQNNNQQHANRDSADVTETASAPAKSPKEEPKYFNDECPVCVDDFSSENGNFMVLDCCHRYHNHCALQWAQSQKQATLTCAICSKAIPKVV